MICDDVHSEMIYFYRLKTDSLDNKKNDTASFKTKK